MGGSVEILDLKKKERGRFIDSDIHVCVGGVDVG